MMFVSLLLPGSPKKTYSRPKGGFGRRLKIEGRYLAERGKGSAEEEAGGTASMSVSCVASKPRHFKLGRT